MGIFFWYFRENPETFIFHISQYWLIQLITKCNWAKIESFNILKNNLW